ncbi:MAG: hypothetical protein CVU36_14755 [Betaproteobacteria bacterium HGW-Betaproteobacteria-9]|nr:MAG: hypothetical protein CVU36_14755 [Betaproteobacteria bacterium HGW-Betaproteobacteria-9]
MKHYTGLNALLPKRPGYADHMTTSQTPWSIAARLGTLLFSAVFALAFGGGGLYFGVLPLARTVSAAWEVRSWQALPAEVLSSQLTSNQGSDSTTYAVQARYRYTAGGRTHESTRVGLDPAAGSDNIGDWHQQWHSRLSSARDRGQPVTVWVDPADPTRAVLDPRIRWAKTIFHLPFALVFTGVGLGALWVFWRALSGRGPGAFDSGGRVRTTTGDAAAQPTGSAVTRSSASRGQALLWFFALFWCGISFPMAALFWMTGSPWWVKVFVSVFVVIGIGVLTLAWRQSVLAWRFAGTSVRFVPAGPQAGEFFEVELALSSRALQNTPPAGRRLRLAQYRVDDSGSGTQERQVEAFERAATAMPDMAGGERWHARFELPADAPTHGGRRSRERVDWRLEILTAEGAVEVSYDVPVQEAPARSAGQPMAAPDRFDRRADWGHEEAIPPRHEGWSAGDAPSPRALPDPVQVQVVEHSDAWEMRFRQSGWRWAAALAMVPVVILSGLWWTSGPRASWSDALGSGLWWGVAFLLLFVLHAGTRQWRLRVRDDGVERELASWMWRRTRVFPLASLDHLFHKLLYTQSSGRATTAFHALHAREAASGPSVRLTPGLPGAASAVAVAQALQVAREHRTGRFTPGVLRPPSVASWRPAAGWLVWTLWLLLLAAGPGWL